MAGFNLVEATISDLQNALNSRSISSVELVALYLERISRYDCQGPTLNAIPILNPAVFEEAAASDNHRASGRPPRLLEGIPYTVKDSYKVKGLTVAAGSPAFRTLVANEDAFVVERLRNEGAVLIGKTNMPPMALGGMQGLYGRAESPYNKDYLTAAFASGSSHGSATATAASLGAFGMGEETVSSGRSPASNNGLVAYTPSKGLFSVRGNWPLYVTCDVIVPQTRTVQDMFSILDAIGMDDEITVGDLWRHQQYVHLPKLSEIRLKTYHELSDNNSLRGKRIGVPKIYIGGADADPEAREVQTRQSVIDLWREARRDLEGQGATVIEVDFPVITKYEKKEFPTQIFNVPGIGDDWQTIERGELIAYAWNDFLLANKDPNFLSMKAPNQDLLYPPVPGSVAFKYTDPANAIKYSKLVDFITAEKKSVFDVKGLEEACKALERARKMDFEDWLDEEALDLVVFPAIGDVIRSDIETNEESAKQAWINGIQYSNGNRAIRHLGIPTVTVTMGKMKDIGMPVGLTFATKAYKDNDVLRYAYAYEQGSKKREAPESTPALNGARFARVQVDSSVLQGSLAPIVKLQSHKYVDSHQFVIQGIVEFPDDSTLESMSVYVDGIRLDNGVKFYDDRVWEVTNIPACKTVDPASEITALVTKDYTMVVVVAITSKGRIGGKLILVRQQPADDGLLTNAIVEIIS